jgi:hypothetical protein
MSRRRPGELSIPARYAEIRRPIGIHAVSRQPNITTRPLHDDRRHDVGSYRGGPRSVIGNSGSREGAPASLAARPIFSQPGPNRHSQEVIALMSPDRFTAVFCLSVPYVPRGDVSVFERMRKSGHVNDFYMFEQIRPDADQIWADAAVTIPGVLYWASGSAPADKR